MAARLQNITDMQPNVMRRMEYYVLTEEVVVKAKPKEVLHIGYKKWVGQDIGTGYTKNRTKQIEFKII